MARRTQNLSDRFWSKVEKTPTCWEWTAVHNGRRYGQFRHRGTMVRAHRFAYEFLVGPIGDGLVLDHLCRNTNCVNPAHLEPVTQGENVRRGIGVGAVAGAHWTAKTHCPQGHPYDECNTYRSARGDRQCRTCRSEQKARSRARLRSS